MPDWGDGNFSRHFLHSASSQRCADARLVEQKSRYDTHPIRTNQLTPLPRVLILLLRVRRGVLSRWRNFYYRALGVKIRGYVWLQKIEIPQQFSSIELCESVALDRGVVLLCTGASAQGPKIRIGDHTYLNRHTMIDSMVSVTIGTNCAVGPGCYITDHDHGMNVNFPPLTQPMHASATSIADNVWIGANVTILKGVSIGFGAVIGAGSVVTRDVPPYAVAVGVPLKVIRVRRNGES